MTATHTTLYVARAFYARGEVQAAGSVFEYDPKADRVLVAELKSAGKLIEQSPVPEAATEFPPVDPDHKGGENNPLTDADAAADLAGEPRPDPAKASKKA